ncbi:hypothetical protein Tco_0858560 [Tanacetum coccineum]|uniref:Retrotransposon gag domain-containing protein n=1 Tax=Tanacetum coccineum TaxID=301880 RepID=A0ABQ5BCF8_9ASTR
MANPAFPDHLPALPDNAPVLPDHLPGAPEPEPAFPDHVVYFPEKDQNIYMDIEAEAEIETEAEESDGDMIQIGVDVVHPEPVTLAVFLVSTIVVRLVEHGGAIQGAGAGNTGGNIAHEARGCTYKEFLGCNPLTKNGTKGAVGLSRWIEKLESNFQIIKCANEDKVKYGACMLQGRALTWWNAAKNGTRNLGLTLKGDDIEGYTNRFHKLATLCPSVLTSEYKKIERYVWGIPDKIQGNVTSSKPATAHEVIRMAHSLINQAIRFKAARISDSNKRKWEEQHKDNNNNNHNNSHHHQLNQRHEVAKAYVATPAEGKGYLGNQPLCN